MKKLIFLLSLFAFQSSATEIKVDNILVKKAARKM